MGWPNSLYTIIHCRIIQVLFLFIHFGLCKSQAIKSCKKGKIIILSAFLLFIFKVTQQLHCIFRCVFFTHAAAYFRSGRNAHKKADALISSRASDLLPCAGWDYAKNGHTPSSGGYLLQNHFSAFLFCAPAKQHWGSSSSCPKPGFMAIKIFWRVRLNYDSSEALTSIVFSVREKRKLHTVHRSVVYTLPSSPFSSAVLRSECTVNVL